ncbi:hypothetical protein NIES4072_07400 [Nostoc commune NIES-4072]|uniref:Uncharacterized protein n=1 Tax=Nostoc commune NIES-4072 TaxID=2005467 RepID=A0A2R5FMT4_NOSCO|nr:hypothetical protein [Nostoc commune]BBD65585.1 hypothetical protein NIES4070_19430 [Nostoc commune HK-02]GBG17091.1 hypothetical protein NIES4072_07400 [Nostoc commune NIES-4072]
MTAVSPVVKPVSQMRLAPGSTVNIEDISWEEFESILQELGEKRSLRVAYSKSTLEIMVREYVRIAEKENVLFVTMYQNQIPDFFKKSGI